MTCDRPRFAVIFILLLIGLVGPGLASTGLDDTAKVLAGLPPSAGSPLGPLTENPAYRAQAAKFAQTWQHFEERQLSRARAWADRELAPVRPQVPVLYYTFSGPDIVYANAFFPDCRTYVLCGLEPAGQIPDLPSLAPQEFGRSLGRLYASLKNVLALSFFKTSEMDSDFRHTDLPGTTPVLMTFLARLGKTVRSAELVAVDRDGREIPRASSDVIGENLTPGVKIKFDSGPGTPAQTVYYFTADISTEGLEKNPGFANFCRTLEPGAGLVKAASYLLHSEPFSGTRDFLMERCKFILQDDTGIPAAVFTDRQWQVRPYGRYVRPIEMFSGYYQKKLAEIYAGSDRKPLDFGVGYYYRIDECNMIMAARDEGAVLAAAVPAVQESLAPEASVVTGKTAKTAIEVGAATSPTPAIVVASNKSGSEPPRKKLFELEEEELRIRSDASLSKKERMQKLREIWKQQLAAMGKSSA